MPQHKVELSPRVQWSFFWLYYVLGWWLISNGMAMWADEDWIVGHLVWSRLMAGLFIMAGSLRVVECYYLCRKLWRL